MQIINSIFSARNKIVGNRKNFIENGYIKVNIEGAILEEIKLNETFIVKNYFKKYYHSCNYLEIYNDKPDKIRFRFNRISDKKESKYVSIEFILDGDTISVVCININITKNYRNKELQLSFFLENNKNPLFNVKFDRKTNELSGEFKSLVYGNSKVNITGEFKVIFTQIFYQFQESTIDEE